MRLDNDNFDVDFRLWINGKSGTFLGEGRVRLLEKIDKTGSIREAANSLNMSYQKAWRLMHVMNQQSTDPLLEKTTGGKKGGGTRLTATGKKWIKIYREWKADCEQSIVKKFEEIKKS